jgi:hypothetical protein
VLRTVVTPRLATSLTVGALLPAGAAANRVTLDGAPVAYQLVHTARGTEVRVPTDGARPHTLVVTT